MSSYGEKLRRERREALAQRALPSEVFNEYGEVFAVTKTEAGASFPASDYAYVPDPNMPSTWKLRLTATPGGAPDAHIVGAAIAALGKGFRGNKVSIPAADLATVKAKVAAAWKKANPDKKPDEMPEFALFAEEFAANPNNNKKGEGDAGEFPASDYAYVPDPEKPSTWKLRLTATPGGEPDSGIVGAAIAALGKGFRGQKVQIPAADLAAVKAKVKAAWKKANPDKKPEEMPSFALFTDETDNTVVACGDSPMAAYSEDQNVDSDDDFLEAILEHHDDILDLLNDYNPTDSDVVDFAAKIDKAVRASSAEIYGLLAKIVVADGESTQDQGNQDNQDVQQGPMAYSLIVSEEEFAGLPPALAAQLVKRLKASLAKTDDPAKKAKLEAEIKKYGG